jgi:hypothetical protein
VKHRKKYICGLFSLFTSIPTQLAFKNKDLLEGINFMAPKKAKLLNIKFTVKVERKLLATTIVKSREVTQKANS